MSKPDLTTAARVMEWAREELEWCYDDDDVPSYTPEDWERATFIAECVRLRQRTDYFEVTDWLLSGDPLRVKVSKVKTKSRGAE